MGIIRSEFAFSIPLALRGLLCSLALAALPALAQTSAADWAATLGSDYELRSNITYNTASNVELKLDVYLPRQRSAALPTLVNFHGGGWVAGRKEDGALALLPYLALGMAVVNVEYRLARVALAPAAVEDCRCALRWVLGYAGEFGLDPAKIVLSGGSAGGHLALITGMLPSGSPVDRHCPTDDSARWVGGAEPPLRVAAIVNYFGITDLPDLLDGANARHYAIEWFGSLAGRSELAQQLSPLAQVRAGLPPVLTIHGDADNVVPYSHALRLHAALDRAGVPNELLTVAGGRHGRFARADVLKNAAAIRAFLRRHGVLAPE